jgi:hypothetical protein
MNRGWRSSPLSVMTRAFVQPDSTRDCPFTFPNLDPTRSLTPTETLENLGGVWRRSEMN